MDKFLTSEKVLMDGDFNGHVGSDMDRVFQIVVKGGVGVTPPSGAES